MCQVWSYWEIQQQKPSPQTSLKQGVEGFTKVRFGQNTEGEGREGLYGSW